MMTMMKNVVALCFFVLIAAAAAAGVVLVESSGVPKLDEAPPSPPLLNISGFAWAENLFFDGAGNLFVSDFQTGTLWRIYYDFESGDYVAGPFSSSNSFAGLAEWPWDSTSSATGVPLGFPVPTLFAAASYNGNATLVALNSSAEIGSIATVVADISDMGNGLALWAPNNDFSKLTLFAALSYQFVANQSKLIRVNVSTGEVTTIFEGLSGADGVEIWCPTSDQSSGCLLFFNEVISGSTFFTYDIDSGLIINQFVPPPPAHLVDDFCLSADGQTVYAADFGTGTVISFATDGSSTNSTVIASGFTNPTAVRIGNGLGFRSTSLYVSEGGGNSPSVTDRRVIEIPNVISEF